MKKLLIILMLLPLLGYNQSLFTKIISTSGSTVVPFSDSIIASIVAFYPLDEQTGTIVFDNYGNNDGVNVDAINGQPPLTNSGTSYEFDGVNSYLDFNTKLITGFPFSISLWAKTDTTSPQYIFCSNIPTVAPLNYYGVAILMDSSYLSIGFGNGNGTSSAQRKSYNYDYDFEVDSIYHLVIRSSSNSYAKTKVYVNNVEVAFTDSSGTATTVSWAEGESNIGRRWGDPTTNKYDGFVQKVFIFNDTVSVVDIATLYNQN